MAEPTYEPDGDGGSGPGNEPGPVIRDRRRLDPETGQVRGRHDAGTPDTSAETGEPDDAETVIQPVGPDGRTGSTEPVTGESAPGEGDSASLNLDGDRDVSL